MCYCRSVTNTITSKVLDRVLDPLRQNLTPDAARALVALRLDEAAQTRMEELASRNTEGQLTSQERMEYEAWVSACDLVTILQTKARAWMNQARAA